VNTATCAGEVGWQKDWSALSHQYADKEMARGNIVRSLFSVLNGSRQLF